MKKYMCTFIAIFLCLLLSGCLSDSTKSAVEEYNSELETYSSKIADYNSAAKQINENNKTFSDEISVAQDDVDKAEEALAPQTLENLRNALISAKGVLEDDVEVLTEYEELTYDENASKDEMKALKKEAQDNTKAMKEAEIPDTPEVVDYSEQLTALQTARQNYENSVKQLAQVTTPSDQFVMERLQRIETISDIEEVTEDHDPNGNLHKSGGYIGAIYFADNQINRADLYIEAGKEGSIDVGTNGGGCVEIYANTDDANSRNTYLSSFDGSILDSGSHTVLGTLIIRTSHSLTATQQSDLTQKITDALTALE